MSDHTTTKQRRPVRVAGCLKRRHPASFAMLAVLFASCVVAAPSTASAAIKVVLSKDVHSSFKKNGRSGKAAERRLNRDFNRGLKELAKTHAGAKALYDSGQTIRVICAKSAEAKKLKIKVGLSPAESHGDFDKSGKPKKGGKTIIAIRCEKLGRFGLDKPFYDIDPRSSGFKVLIHELLHATDKARRHPPDSFELYHKFVDSFVAAIRAAKRAERRARKKADRRQSSVPSTPGQDGLLAFASPVKLALDLNLSFLEASGQVTPTFGNALSGSRNISEFSIGADVRVPVVQIADGVSLVGGGWAKVFPEGGKSVAILERHAPTPGLDTRMLQNQLGFLFAYAGIQFSRIGELLNNPALCETGALFCDAAVTLFLGPRLQFNKVTLKTDESGGGGVQERFTKNTTKVGVTIGADVDIPLQTEGGLQYFFRLGGAFDYTPATQVKGRSSLGFDYEGEIDSRLDGRVFLGFGIELPAETFVSDMRLKTGIKPAGRDASGFRLYRYRYVWGGPEWIGVMAQEVAETRPDAIVSVNGWLAVDYARLGLRPRLARP